jgi:hypothetical protein
MADLTGIGHWCIFPELTLCGKSNTEEVAQVTENYRSRQGSGAGWHTYGLLGQSLRESSSQRATNRVVSRLPPKILPPTPGHITRTFTSFEPIATPREILCLV